MARNGFRKMAVSMRGVAIDMDALSAANESSRAIGNGKMNARGDILGTNGQIEVRREQIARDYYKSNPQASKQVSLKPALPDVFETPEQAMARMAELSRETDMPEGLVQRPRGRKLVDKNDD
jgi:hypothetical protein